MLFSHSLPDPLFTFIYLLFLKQRTYLLFIYMYVRQPYVSMWYMKQNYFCRCIMDASISSFSTGVDQKKGALFCKKIPPQNFSLSLFSSYLFLSLVLSLPCSMPQKMNRVQQSLNPTGAPQASAGAEIQDLCDSAFAPCSICQNFLNRAPNTLL